MITVLLVDDERMVCAHLRTILTAAEDISVVGEAYDGAEAVEAVIRLRPHVVLLDLRMPASTASPRSCGSRNSACPPGWWR